MIAFGGLTALYNSSTYGVGVEVTSPQHGSTMYFAVLVSKIIWPPSHS